MRASVYPHPGCCTDSVASLEQRDSGFARHCFLRRACRASRNLLVTPKNIVGKAHGGKCGGPHTGSKGRLGVAPDPLLRVIAVMCMHSPIVEALDRNLLDGGYVCGNFLVGLRIRPKLLDRCLVRGGYL